MSDLKRPGRGSRANNRNFVENGTGGGSLVDNIVSASRVQARTNGYHNESSLPASRGLSDINHDADNGSVRLPTDTAPTLEKQTGLKLDIAAAQELREHTKGVTRLVGSPAVTLFHESIAKLVPATKKMTLTTFTDRSLVANISGVQYGSDSRLTQERSAQHMQKLGQKSENEPMSKAMIAANLLPFAEIREYQGSTGVAGDTMVYGKMVDGLVKALDPSLEVDAPFEIIVKNKANGSLQIRATNFSLSRDFGGYRDDFIIVALKYMRLKNVYVCKDEEDQEDFEARLEEVIEKMKGEKNCEAKQKLVARLVWELREEAEVETSQQEAIHVQLGAPNGLKTVAREQTKHEAARSRQITQAPVKFHKAQSVHDDGEPLVGTAKHTAELDELLAGFEARLADRQGRTFREWVADKKRELAEEEQGEEEVDEVEDTNILPQPATQRSIQEEVEEFLGSDYESDEDDLPFEDGVHGGDKNGDVDQEVKASPEAPVQSSKRKAGEEDAEHIVTKKARYGPPSEEVRPSTEEPQKSAPKQQSCANPPKTIAPSTASDQKQPQRPKPKPQQRNKKATQLPIPPNSSPDDSTATSTSTWPADDPALLAGYRELSKLPSTTLWPNTSKAGIDQWLKDHAPDYRRGRHKANKAELQGLIREIVVAYPIPGEKGYRPGKVVKRHVRGVYARVDDAGEDLQMQMFRQSYAAQGLAFPR